MGLNDLKFGQEFISEIGDPGDSGDSGDPGDSGDSGDSGYLRNEFQAKFTNFANFDPILTQFGSKRLKIWPGIHFIRSIRSHT